MKKQSFIIFIWIFLSLITFKTNANNFTTIEFVTHKGIPIEISNAYSFTEQNRLIILGKENFIILVDMASLDNKIIKLDLSNVKFKSIKCLTELSDSELLLGTDKGVYFFSLITKQLKPFDKTLPPDRINDLKSFDDYIVIVFKKNVIVYKQRLWKQISTKNFKYLGEFKKVVSDQFGVLWLVGEKGLVPLNKDIKIIKPLHKKIRDVVVDNTGFLYVLTNNALYNFNGENWIQLSDNKNDYENLGVDNTNSLVLFNDEEIGILIGNKIKKIDEEDLFIGEKWLEVLNNGIDKTYFVSQEHLLFQKNFPCNFYKIIPEIVENFSLFLLVNNKEYSQRIITKIDQYYQDLENTTKLKWLEILLDKISITGDEIISLKTIENRISHLNSESDKMRLYKKLIRAAQVVSPELSFSFQMEIIKAQTTPENIIESKLKLAKLFSIYNETPISSAIYQDISHTFSPNIRGVDWALYNTLENGKNCDFNNLKETLIKNTSDPIVHIKTRYLMYNEYLTNFILQKYQNLLRKFIKIDLNHDSNWNIYNGAEACYLTNDKNQIFICSPNESDIKLLYNNTPILKIISSKLGDFALTTQNKIIDLNSKNKTELTTGFKLPSQINDMYLNKDVPVFITKTKIYSYNLKSEQWESYTIPNELRSFNFLLVCSQDSEEWIFVTNSKVFVYSQKTRKIESIPLPITVINITDAFMDIGGFLYIGTNSGLYLYHNKKWISQDAATGFLGNNIKDILYNPKENIVILECDSTFYIRKNNLWFNLNSNKYINSKVKHVAADSKGYLYILTGKKLMIWNSQEGSGPLIILNAGKAAEILNSENRIKDLSEFLNLLTTNTFVGDWAYEYRGRVLFKLNDFKGAYDHFQYGVKLYKQSHWFSDTVFVTFIYDLLQKKEWKIAMQTTDLLFSMFPQSSLKNYLLKLIIDNCGLGPFNEHLENRLETIFWLRDRYSIQNYSERVDELQKFILLRNFYLNPSQSNTIAFLKRSLSEKGTDQYKLLWTYLILLSDRIENTKFTNNKYQENEMQNLLKLRSNYLNQKIGDLLLKRSLANLLQFR